jgi:hypothetical protein
VVRRVNIREWIATFFPVLSVSPPNWEREAMIQLISLGTLGKSGLDGIAIGDIPVDDKQVIRVGSAMLDAYGAVLMRKYKISSAELLPPEKIVQFAKECVEGTYKFPGTK